MKQIFITTYKKFLRFIMYKSILFDGHIIYVPRRGYSYKEILAAQRYADEMFEFLNGDISKGERSEAG